MKGTFVERPKRKKEEEPEVKKKKKTPASQRLDTMNEVIHTLR